MKKQILALCVISLCLPLLPAAADGGMNQNFFSRGNDKTKLELGAESFYFDYKESGIMEESGVFYGVLGSYTYRNVPDIGIDSLDGSKPVMFKLEGRLDFGQVDYTSDGTGSIDGINDWIFEIRGLSGYDFPLGKLGNGRITPYTGLAYRYLNDDTSGDVSSTGHFGYERESNYYYLPVGVEVYREFSGDWSAALTLEFDWLMYGKQRSHLGDAVSGLNTVDNDQHDGYGARASVKVVKSNPAFDFFAEPFVRYWDINDSQVSAVLYNSQIVGTGVEPANTSVEAGLRLGIQY